MMQLFLLPLIMLVIAAGVTMVVITPQQHVRMIETFGKFSAVKTAGLSFKMPWPIQTASRPFSMKTRQFNELVQVKSSDNVFVKIPVAVQYRVISTQVKQAYYELESPEMQMKSYVVNEVKSIASNMDFQKLYTDKDELSADLKSSLEEKMHGYGYEIIDVLIDDPQPTEKVVDAFNDVIASKRAKEAAEGYAQAERVKRVAEAEATGEAQKISAEATVEARRIMAEGNAEAIRRSVEGTNLPDTFGHDLVRMSIMAESIRDAARQGGKVVYVAGEERPNSTHAMLAGNQEGEHDKEKANAVKNGRAEAPDPLDEDGDGIIDH